MFERGEPCILFKDVEHRYRVLVERRDTLRETFVRLFNHAPRFREFTVLQDVSFNVFAGETLGIVGRNGAGKSTILKLIAGIFRPARGKITVHGQVASLIELGAGFHPELSGRENIELNGLLLGLSKREIAQREAGIIEFAELGDFIDAPVKQYSSGMYMRLVSQSRWRWTQTFCLSMRSSRSVTRTFGANALLASAAFNSAERPWCWCRMTRR